MKPLKDFKQGHKNGIRTFSEPLLLPHRACTRGKQNSGRKAVMSKRSQGNGFGEDSDTEGG